MSAKDDLYRQISACSHYKSKKFTTQNCERFTSASHSVISLYLNQLCEEGFAEGKCQAMAVSGLANLGLTVATQRPEQYVDLALIGATGSLKSALELCQAAINYPAMAVYRSWSPAPAAWEKTTSLPCCTTTPVKTT